jgi:hypothetical protein
VDVVEGMWWRGWWKMWWRSFSHDLTKMPLLYQFCWVATTRIFASFHLKSELDPDLEFLAGEIGGKFWGEILALFFFLFIWIKNVKFCEVDMNNVVHRGYNYFSKMGTHVHPRMANNVVHRSFQFYRVEKPFSIFRVSKLGFFMKQLPKLALITGAHQFSKVLDHILYTFHQ